MTIGSSLILMAIGAILKFAVSETLAGIDLQVVGVILMIVGGIGMLFGIFQLGVLNRRGSYVNPADPREPPVPPVPPAL